MNRDEYSGPTFFKFLPPSWRHLIIFHLLTHTTIPTLPESDLWRGFRIVGSSFESSFETRLVNFFFGNNLVAYSNEYNWL